MDELLIGGTYQIKEVIYEGQLTLDNGMTRFMVIGK